MDSESKLEMLARIEGYGSVMDMYEASVRDCVVPGICTNADCDYTSGVEPDCSRGHCEWCDTQTVASCLILGDLI